MTKHFYKSKGCWIEVDEARILLFVGSVKSEFKDGSVIIMNDNEYHGKVLKRFFWKELLLK